MKILMVGNMHPMYQPIHYAHAFEERGDTVIKLAVDQITEENEYDYHVADGMSIITKYNLATYLYAYDMKDIVKKTDPDIIFIFQCHVAFNLKGVDTKTIPVYFYAKNPHTLVLPRFCYIKGMFYGWPGGQDDYEEHYPWLMRNSIHYHLPCGWSPSFFINTHNKRKFFIGHMGNYNIKNLYDNRNKFKKHIEDKYNNHKSIRFLFRRNPVEYKRFMNMVNIALNVPANNTDVNERSFHSMGMGCVNLHYDNGNLYKYGFIDKVNSLLFKNKDELDEQILFSMNNPSKIEEIRRNGIKFASQHTFRKRAEEIRSTINNRIK